MLAFALRAFDRSGDLEFQHSQPCKIWMQGNKVQVQAKEGNLKDNILHKAQKGTLEIKLPPFQTTRTFAHLKIWHWVKGKENLS